MNTPLKKTIFRLVDFCVFPLMLVSVPLFRMIRRYGVKYFPLSRFLFLHQGVFPIRDHYYEPLFLLPKDFEVGKTRELQLTLSLEKQLQGLNRLQYSDELKSFPETAVAGGFYVRNPSFGPGDWDLYYLLIRNSKPRNIIEIGSGFSTLVAYEAIRKNRQEGALTKMTCIEPYENKWLETLPDITLIRQKVETVSPDLFETLEENDILFIDSSHVIRLEGDVLFEYLTVLPRLKKGVIIHVHDIFTPRHYRSDWLDTEFRFWNEQYLLEAFLYFNDHFEIMYAANFLKHEACQDTARVLTSLTENDEPSSFWMRKIK